MLGLRRIRVEMGRRFRRRARIRSGPVWQCELGLLALRGHRPGRYSRLRVRWVMMSSGSRVAILGALVVMVPSSSWLVGGLLSPLVSFAEP